MSSIKSLLCLKIFCNFRMSPIFVCAVLVYFFVYFVQILAEAKELSRVHTLAASDSKIDPLLQSK